MNELGYRMMMPKGRRTAWVLVGVGACFLVAGLLIGKDFIEGIGIGMLFVGALFTYTLRSKK
jgi:hypothetical protein